MGRGLAALVVAEPILASVVTDGSFFIASSCLEMGSPSITRPSECCRILAVPVSMLRTKPEPGRPRKASAMRVNENEAKRDVMISSTFRKLAPEVSSICKMYCITSASMSRKGDLCPSRTCVDIKSASLCAGHVCFDIRSTSLGITKA